MKPRKKGKQWEISYRCPGHPRPVYERFSSLELANIRIAEIEYDRSRGQLRPPVVTPLSKDAVRPKKSLVTVAELMDEYVQLYGLNHWSESTLSYSQHRIDDYIKPYLGSVYIQDLTAHSLDVFYDSLLDKPAVVLKGHKAKKQISPSVIAKIHALLRSALNQAVAWGYIPSNPAMNCSPPKYDAEERAVWTQEEAKQAIAICDDPALKLAMQLAMGVSGRIGELLGLTWDCVDISPESMEAQCPSLYINKELKRCDKASLEKLQRRGSCKIYRAFPERKRSECTTVLVLKAPKTASSVRQVYLPKTVAEALLATKAHQQELKELLGDAYQDFDLVIAQEDGRPFEERMIAKKLKTFIQKNDLRPVVFHSLRHCSTSIKLKLSGGNIKAVQGDTGHAQARMVTDVYSHIFDDERRSLAQKLEAEFFQQNKKAAADETTAMACQLLRDNPELAKLLLAMHTAAS